MSLPRTTCPNWHTNMLHQPQLEELSQASVCQMRLCVLICANPIPHSKPCVHTSSCQDSPSKNKNVGDVIYKSYHCTRSTKKTKVPRNSMSANVETSSKYLRRSSPKASQSYTLGKSNNLAGDCVKVGQQLLSGAVVRLCTT